MYLLDTNIWLESLLGQSRADEVADFLDKIPSEKLFISDFSFHSICVILSRLNRKYVLIDFVQDVFIAGKVSVIALQPEETSSLVLIMDNFRLDFDDAYQYLLAEQWQLTLVSFDKDFKRTPRGAQSPADVSASL